jgi:ferredoxin
MTKILIDQDKCIGCNTCPLIDPEVFEMDTTIYKARVKNQPGKVTESVQSAIDSCPVGAISASEE